jgi:hypothetical protein
MSDFFTRREILGWMGALGIALRYPDALPIQEQESLKALEARLSQGFPPEIKPLIQKALAQYQHYSELRGKHPLPEGSEPCTIFVPRGKP